MLSSRVVLLFAVLTLAVASRVRRDVVVDEAAKVDEEPHTAEETTTHKVVTTKVIEKRRRVPRVKKAGDTKEIVIIKEDKDKDEKSTKDKVVDAAKKVGHKLKKWVQRVGGKKPKPDQDDKKVLLLKEEEPQVLTKDELVVPRRTPKLGESAETQKVTIKRVEEEDVEPEVKVKTVAVLAAKETPILVRKRENIIPATKDAVEVQDRKMKVLILEEDLDSEQPKAIPKRLKPAPKVVTLEEKVEVKAPLQKVFPVEDSVNEDTVVSRRGKPSPKKDRNVDKLDVSDSESSTQTVVTTREKEVVIKGRKGAVEEIPAAARKVVTAAVLLPKPEDPTPKPATIEDLSLLKNSFVKSVIRPANIFPNGTFA